MRKNEKTTCCISGLLQSPLTRKKHRDDHISSFDRCVGGDDELGVGSSFVMPLVASLWAKNCQEKTWKNIFPHKSQHFFEKVILPANTIPFHAWNHADILIFCRNETLGGQTQLGILRKCLQQQAAFFSSLNQ